MNLISSVRGLRCITKKATASTTLARGPLGPLSSRRNLYDILDTFKVYNFIVQTTRFILTAILKFNGGIKNGWRSLFKGEIPGFFVSRFADI